MIKDKTIFIKNIYYMLSYAFTPLTQGGYENVEKEEFDNIHNLFAAILAKGIGSYYPTSSIGTQYAVPPMEIYI